MLPFIDLALTEDGELIIDEAGDLKPVLLDESKAKMILFILKTTRGDCLIDPGLGASLEEFIGSPNNERTWSAMKSRIYASLEYKRIAEGCTVEVVPLDRNSCLILVEYPATFDTGQVFQVVGKLDLREGLVFSRMQTRRL